MKPIIPIAVGWMIAAGAASAVFGETREIGGSKITLQDSVMPGAVAEVEFFNRATNWPSDNGSYDLTHGALTVSVTFTWNAAGSSDRIDVTPPAGYVAEPPFLTLSEGETGFVYIRLFELVGM